MELICAFPQLVQTATPPQGSVICVALNHVIPCFEVAFGTKMMLVKLSCLVIGIDINKLCWK